jgi:hypothetical protein
MKLNSLYEKHISDEEDSILLFETKKYGARDLNIVPFLLKLYRLDLIMHSIAKCRVKHAAIEGRFFEMRAMDSRKLARRFNIMVDNERVNSADLVSTMIRYSTNMSDEARRANLASMNPVLADSDLILNVPDNLMNNYRSLGEEFKEPLALNYLRAACFKGMRMKVIRDCKPYDF